MKKEFVANSCRICLTETKKLRSLYKPIEDGDEPPNRMLHLITGIIVERLDEHETLPKNICKNCELSLSMAFEFRENALKTQKIIVSHLKELQESDSTEEISKSSMSMYKSDYDDIMNIEPLDCVDSLEDDIQDLNEDKNKYCLEQEELDETVSSEENCQEENDDIYNEQETFDIDNSKEVNNCEKSTDRSYLHQQDHNNEDKTIMDHESIIGDNQDDFECIEEQFEIMSAEEENYVFHQQTLNATNSTKQNKQISEINIKLCNTKGKITEIHLPENIKIIPIRGRKPSKSANQNRHICDICGNVFAKRGRMMEHRQRHDKECRFCCEICDKKFLTRELLRKHMFSHSGGKPLKCEFCSRTFYYESVRKAHEAVHKGLRPYVCDDCGKGFSYAHALKKHKLIHAEIKLYRCEYCNKDFRLQHHMKQHELTKLHKNAIRFAKDYGKVLREENLDGDVLFVEEMPNEEVEAAKM